MQSDSEQVAKLVARASMNSHPPVPVSLLRAFVSAFVVEREALRATSARDGKIDLKDCHTTCKNYGKSW